MKLLDDIRVLDLGGFITGPYTAMLLADFGADVVKVERPGGDPFRALRDDLYSPQFQAHNRNKRSLLLDYARPEGLDVLKELVRATDVLVLNSRACRRNSASATRRCARSIRGSCTARSQGLVPTGPTPTARPSTMSARRSRAG
jgi:CoA-transferase family III